MVAIPSHPEAVGAAAATADRQLRDACLALLPGAWEAFVDRFAGLFFLVIDRTADQRGVTLSQAEREALVAETLLELFRDDAAALRACTLRASLTSYLTVFARRVAVAAFQRQLESGAGSEAAAVPAPHDDPPPPGDAPEPPGNGPLDADESRLLDLYHRGRKSYGEISRITGLPLGAIGPALARARAKLPRAESREGSPEAAGEA